MAYIPGGYPDQSTTPSNSYRTIASAALALLGTSQQLNGVAWCMQATPAATLASDGSMTVTVPDLSMWFLGATTAAAIAGAVWTGLTSGTAYIFYINGSPTAGWTFGVQAVSAGVLAIGVGQLRYVAFATTLTAS